MTTTPEGDRRPSPGEAQLQVFTVLLAVASVFHFLGNSRAAPAWSQVLVACAVALALVRPSSIAALVLLAGVDLLTVWLELPFAANHWLLLGAANLAVLIGVLHGVATGVRAPSGIADRVLPAVRVCTLLAYGFAAVDKLNSSFFDPDLSCATLLFDDATRGLGLGTLPGQGSTGARWAMIIAAAGIELAVVTLLAVRRTRVWGSLLGLAFHFLVAFNPDRALFNFTAALFVLFPMFLPPAFFVWVLARVEALRSHLARRSAFLPTAFRLALAALAAVALLGPAGRRVSGARLADFGWWAWQPLALGVLAAVGIWLRRHSDRSSAPLGLTWRPALLIAPALVLLNGVAPFLELRTAAVWNMYANLRTADGDSNHFLVPASLPLRDGQSDLVAVVESDLPELDVYREERLLVPRVQVAHVIARAGGASATVESEDGSTQRLTSAGSDRLSTLAWKLASYQAVGAGDEEPCNDRVFPAR